MHDWPLLDIPKALDDADRCLADIDYYVQCCQQESEGHYPPTDEAATLRANVTALRELLALVIPARLKAEIGKEQAIYDAQMAQWEV